MTNETISYMDKKVFIGIDVHRHSYAVTALCDGVVIKSWRMESNPRDLVFKLQNYFNGANLLTCYEAGFSGFSLHRILTASGIENYVINAASLEVSSRDRVKTDKKDSRKLAIQLSVGRLRSIRVPSEEQELARDISRVRGQQIRSRNRIMNQLRMKLHYFGFFPSTYKGVLQKKFVLEVAKAQGAELRLSLESLCSIWGALDKEILNLNKQLREQAKVDPLDSIYRSIPGIGPVSTRVLSTELGDMTQFSNERALFSFTGLTPMEFSSGENRRLGKISRQGNSRIRHVLVEAAWVAIRKDKELKRAFDRISIRAGKKRAIVAIARKLIGRARALSRSKVLYELEHSEAA